MGMKMIMKTWGMNERKDGKTKEERERKVRIAWYVCVQKFKAC